MGEWESGRVGVGEWESESESRRVRVGEWESESGSQRVVVVESFIYEVSLNSIS